MRLLSYRVGNEESFGAVSGEGVVDLRRALGGRYASLADMLGEAGLAEVREAVQGRQPDVALSDITYQPVIPNPSRLVCIGVNYRAHAAEAGRAETGYPSVFLRLNDSVVGHEEPILRPRVSGDLDYEGELAVIIGRPGRYIARADAMSHVAGFSCFNDASIRDWQRHNPGPTPGKNFYRCGSFGPWLVTADEVPDYRALQLTTRVNGEERQNTTLDLMIFDVEAIIEYVSGFTPLQTGDVISTGTPAGVAMGHNPPPWMKAGDVVEVSITGIGTLRNRIAAEE